MNMYVGDDCEIAIQSELDDGLRPLVVVVQGESCFASNDGWKKMWKQKDGNVLRPKGSGKKRNGFKIPVRMPRSPSFNQRTTNSASGYPIRSWNYD